MAAEGGQHVEETKERNGRFVRERTSRRRSETRSIERPKTHKVVGQEGVERNSDSFSLEPFTTVKWEATLG